MLPTLVSFFFCRTQEHPVESYIQYNITFSVSGLYFTPCYYLLLLSPLVELHSSFNVTSYFPPLVFTPSYITTFFSFTGALVEVYPYLQYNIRLPLVPRYVSLSLPLNIL